MDLDGKVALVTGAGSGIGRATAERFVECGAKVVAADIVDAGLRELEGRVHPVVGDVSNPADADGMVQQALEQFGRIDVLANVAGIADRLLPVAEMTDEVWDRVLAVDLTGPMRLCRAAIPPMLEIGGGAIVNVASVAGFTGAKAGAAYTAAKHGLVGLTRNIAAMYGSDGIRCNVVCPGVTLTGIEMGGDPSPLGVKVVLEPLAQLGPPAQPEQMASVIAFLASDDASHVNGIVVPVDAGWTAS